MHDKVIVEHSAQGANYQSPVEQGSRRVEKS